MTTDGRYTTSLTYVDHTSGAVRPHHTTIMQAIANDGALPAELSDLITLNKAPLLNADGSPRWLVDWA